MTTLTRRAVLQRIVPSFAALPDVLSRESARTQSDPRASLRGGAAPRSSGSSTVLTVRPGPPEELGQQRVRFGTAAFNELGVAAGTIVALGADRIPARAWHAASDDPAGTIRVPDILRREAQRHPTESLAVRPATAPPADRVVFRLPPTRRRPPSRTMTGMMKRLLHRRPVKEGMTVPLRLSTNASPIQNAGPDDIFELKAVSTSVDGIGRITADTTVQLRAHSLEDTDGWVGAMLNPIPEPRTDATTYRQFSVSIEVTTTSGQPNGEHE